jgi:hypothetical protein
MRAIRHARGLTVIYCNLCREPVEDVEQAVEDGWIPDYWDEHKDREVCSPVCEACAVFALDEDENGYYLPVRLTVIR